MFLRRTTFLSLALTACITTAFAQTLVPRPPGAALEVQVQKVYDDYGHAIRTMDSDRFVSFLAKDFKLVGADGKVRDRAEMLERHRQNVKTTRRVNSFETRIYAINRLGPEEVSVIVLQRYDRDQVPLDEPDQPRNIKTAVVQRETWRGEAAGWKLHKIEEILAGPVMLDGDPVAP